MRSRGLSLAISLLLIILGLPEGSLPCSGCWELAGTASRTQAGLTRVADHSRNEARAYQHLYEVMDKYHDAFDIYTDQDAGGNHGYPSGWMGDIGALQLDTGWTENCHSGATCIKVTWSPREPTWAGIRWQEPEDNWGTVKDGGYDLRGATELSFWARGEEGGEPIDFILGGIRGDYPDSIQPTIHTGIISLSKEWKRYSIDLRGKDLSKVIGLFGWVSRVDPVFYLDDIRYDKARPEALRFLTSYETLASTGPDRYLRNASFIYDNALVLLALIARGKEEDRARAKLLADAFIYAQEHDRYYSDGRLRNAYMSGDLADHQTGKARLPGWWDPEEKEWFEDSFQVSSYTGNLAWVMIALLEYYKVEGGDKYLQAAIRLGDWIYDHTYDTRGAGGYTGGYEGWGPSPKKIRWKSTEHNLDCYVAFMKLYGVTGDPVWRERAGHARSFLEAMWDEAGGHFWVGTLEDGVTINKGPQVLDVNTWGLMALLDEAEKYRRGISWAERSCALRHHGFAGFDFNADRDGVWFEGTAQMALAYKLLGQQTKAEKYLAELERAQLEAQNNNGKGMVAACHDGLTTGLGWKYFSRLHIGATAWYILAERGYNPLDVSGLAGGL